MIYILLLSLFGKSFIFLSRIDTAHCMLLKSNVSMPNQTSIPESLIFEGDIILPSLNRNALTVTGKWKEGFIPYVFDVYSDENLKRNFREAAQLFFDVTDGCIVFIPRTNQADYIQIKSKYAKGCLSGAGRFGGRQELHLAPGCRDQGTILHEMFHATGFLHEQSRLDRDDFVIIQFPNIVNGQGVHFKKHEDTITYGVPYDYESIVHYRQFDFSKNGQPTIITKDPKYQHIIGTTNTLSEKDILKVKLKYECIKYINNDDGNTDEDNSEEENGWNNENEFIWRD